MKKILLCSSIALLILGNANAQDFNPLATGNFAGVTGLSYNPASIVDSRHKFDINLFSTNLSFSNNYLELDGSAITRFNKRNFENWDEFKNNYVHESNLGNQRAWAHMFNRTQLPLSFMASIGRKSAIALNLQSRSLVQVENLSPQFARLAYNNFDYNPAFATGIDNGGYHLNAMNFMDIGLTFGTVIFNSDQHFLKGAITGKYLGGIKAFNTHAENFTMSVNPDNSYNINTTNHVYNHSDGADFGMVFDRSFRPDGSSFAFDAGLVYEFRGNIENFRMISRDDEKSYTVDRRDVNKYMVRLGAALIDAGKISFTNAPNARNFSGNIANWDIKNANYTSLAEFDQALAARTTAVGGNQSEFTMNLPTALNVNLDLRLVRGFYINAMAYRPLELKQMDGISWNNYGFYAITPRWESRHFGVYVPYTMSNYEDITGYENNQLGLTLRLGPLHIGSTNLGSVVFNDRIKRANVHVGLKVGFTHGRPNKTTEFLESLGGAERVDTTRRYLTDDDIILDSAGNAIRRDVQVVVEMDSTATRRSERTIIDYKNGRIIKGSRSTGDVIIINNYYSNRPGAANAPDRIMIDTVTDRVRIINQEQIQRNIQTTDSLQIKAAEMDSLMRRMEQLRTEMNEAEGRRTTMLDSLIRDQQVAALNEQTSAEAELKKKLYPRTS